MTRTGSGFFCTALAGLVLTVLVAGTLAHAQGDNSPPMLDIVPHPNWPELVSHVDPVYPLSKASTEKGGWARVRFCIEVDGSVSNVAVVDTSAYGESFGQAARDAISQWTYATPMAGGKPQRFCEAELRYHFFIVRRFGLSHSFVSKHRQIVADVRGGRLGEAEREIEALFASENLNGMEYDRLYMLQAALFNEKGDFEAARVALSRVLDIPSAHMDRKEEGAALRSYFMLLFDQKLYGAALKTLVRLEGLGVLKPDDPIAQAGAAIRKARAGGERFAVRARITDACDCDMPFYRYEPLNREIGLQKVSGTVDRVSMACTAHIATIDYEPGWSWRAPESYGECSVFIYGTPGTTFEIVEY